VIIGSVKICLLFAVVSECVGEREKVYVKEVDKFLLLFRCKRGSDVVADVSSPRSHRIRFLHHNNLFLNGEFG